MSDTILEVDYRPGEEIVLRFKIPKFLGLPDSSRGHLLAARKETLLAFRSMLDSAIERAEEPRKVSRKKRAKIEVQ